MKAVSLVVGIAGGILLSLGCVQETKESLVATVLNAAEGSEQIAKVDLDPVLLEKIRPLYPKVRLERQQGEPSFSSVKEVARVRLGNGTERLVVWVHLVIPAAMVDHGLGDLLIFKDARDALPTVQKSLHSLSVMRASDIHLIKEHWLQFGTGSPLVSLVDEESLKHFGKHGTNGLFQGLSVEAVQSALDVYLKDGREAFLQRVPIAKHQERNVRNLPDRISRVEMYPSLTEDMRPSGFKYSSAWEGTILIRVIPADESEKPIVLEIGTKGWAEGITSDDVELHIWETRTDEPSDRPAAGSQWFDKAE